MTTQTLIAIHDFVRRAEDEISLVKDDLIDVLEDDQEYGDGWYIVSDKINAFFSIEKR